MPSERKNAQNKKIKMEKNTNKKITEQEVNASEIDKINRLKSDEINFIKIDKNNLKSNQTNTIETHKVDILKSDKGNNLESEKMDYSNSNEINFIKYKVSYIKSNTVNNTKKNIKQDEETIKQTVINIIDGENGEQNTNQVLSDKESDPSCDDDDFIYSDSSDSSIDFSGSNDFDFFPSATPRNHLLFSESSEQEDIAEYFVEGHSNEIPDLQNIMDDQKNSSTCSIDSTNFTIHSRLFRTHARICSLSSNCQYLCLLDTHGIVYILHKHIFVLIIALKLSLKVTSIGLTEKSLYMGNDRVPVLKMVELEKIMSYKTLASQLIGDVPDQINRHESVKTQLKENELFEKKSVLLAKLNHNSTLETESDHITIENNLRENEIKHITIEKESIEIDSIHETMGNESNHNTEENQSVSSQLTEEESMRHKHNIFPKQPTDVSYENLSIKPVQNKKEQKVTVFSSKDHINHISPHIKTIFLEEPIRKIVILTADKTQTEQSSGSFICLILSSHILFYDSYFSLLSRIYLKNVMDVTRNGNKVFITQDDGISVLEYVEGKQINQKIEYKPGEIRNKQSNNTKRTDRMTNFDENISNQTKKTNELSNFDENTLNQTKKTNELKHLNENKSNSSNENKSNILSETNDLKPNKSFKRNRPTKKTRLTQSYKSNHKDKITLSSLHNGYFTEPVPISLPNQSFLTTSCFFNDMLLIGTETGLITMKLNEGVSAALSTKIRKIGHVKAVIGRWYGIVILTNQGIRVENEKGFYKKMNGVMLADKEGVFIGQGVHLHHLLIEASQNHKLACSRHSK